MTTISALSLSVLALFSINVRLVFTLECYVCDNQEDNTGKCVTTIKTCQQGEDVCLSEIRWGSTPYWTQGALKQFYITKDCSTKDRCKWHRDSNMALCTHIWYEDWKCSECCKGDRCNYYIISGAHREVVPHLFLSVILALVFSNFIL